MPRYVTYAESGGKSSWLHMERRLWLKLGLSFCIYSEHKCWLRISLASWMISDARYYDKRSFCMAYPWELGHFKLLGVNAFTEHLTGLPRGMKLLSSISDSFSTSYHFNVQDATFSDLGRSPCGRRSRHGLMVRLRRLMWRTPASLCLSLRKLWPRRRIMWKVLLLRWVWSRSTLQRLLLFHSALGSIPSDW